MQQAPIRSQALVYGCLVLSGSTSLVYELLWTRILSFSFGSTSLAFAAVLAVFFLGLAGGSLLGGRAARRLSDPLRAYGWLELAIGLYAGASFPLLFQLHHIFALHNAGGAEPSGLALRFAAAAAVLAFPTLCMGATFPVLFEHLRRERSHLTEALGRLYGINTLGAFLGVYLATHWLIPFLGLDKANYAAVALNVLVFALSRLPVYRPDPAHGPAPAGDSAPGSPPAAAYPEASGATAAVASVATPPPPASPRLAAVGLLLLSASGFITLGYEVVWGRVLTISMEGSLYGIGATLGSFLAGIGLGGLAFAFIARKLPGPTALFRSYVVVCLAVVAYLALSRLLLPVEGYLLRSVTQGVRGLLGLHLNFAIAVIFLLPVTAGLGYMFPAAVSLYAAGRANPAEGAGKAYALNTAMSVAGSLLSATFLMDLLGIEGIVFLGVHVMLLTLLAAVLLAEAGKPDRRLWLALAALPPLLVAAWWPSIDAKTVLIGALDGKPPSLSQAFQSLAVQFAPRNALKVYKDGVGSTLTVSVHGRTASVLSNGLPQSGRSMDPPHYNLESILVGLLPAMHRPDAGNALVVGLGAGISVDVLRRAGVPSVEVVELEPAMANICRSIHPKGESPLDDTGVTLRQDDARNFLVRNGYRGHHGDRRRWDIIASQPAHPWVSGAADLFTEEMFRLAYANLSDGGVFCQWFMPSGIDEAAFAALANAFGNVFDSVLVYRSYGGYSGFYFIGTRGGSRLSLQGVEAVFGRPGLRQLLALHRHPRPEDVFKYALIGVSDGAALRFPGRPVNRDRNAFVESRMPLLPKGMPLPLEGVPGMALTGPLPAGFQGAGADDTLFAFRAIDALSGNIPSPVATGEPDSLQTARFRVYGANAPSPFREYYESHLALASGAPRARLDTAAGRALASGRPLLAAQLRLLRLRLGPASPTGHLLPDGLPPDFLRDFRSQQALSAALAAAAAPDPALARAADSAAALAGVDTLVRDMAAVMRARRLGDPGAAALDDAALEAVYRKVSQDWIHWDACGEALEWYCAARGRKTWARMTRRALDDQRERRAQRILDTGLRLKRAGKRQEALAAFSRALELDPALQNAYIGKAEIYGLAKDQAAFDSLAAGIRRDFATPDVVLHLAKEAYLLKPDSRPDTAAGGE